MQVGTTRLKRNAAYAASSDRSSAYRTQLRKRLCNKSPCSYALLILYSHNDQTKDITIRYHLDESLFTCVSYYASGKESQHKPMTVFVFDEVWKFDDPLSLKDMGGRGTPSKVAGARILCFP